MEKKKRKNEIDEQIKALLDEKNKLNEEEGINAEKSKESNTEVFNESSKSADDLMESEKDETDHKLTKEEIAKLYEEYELPTPDKATEVVQEIDKFRQINVYALPLGGVIALISFFIGGSDGAYSMVLGILTSLFCQTIMINDYKRMATIHIAKYRSKAIQSNLKRYAIYVAVLFFVWVYRDKGFMLGYTFVGFLTTKLATVIYLVANKGGVKK